MRHFRFFIPLCILSVMLAAGWTAAVAQGQWEVVVPAPTVAEKVRMAAFFNENFGITGGAGDVGKARYTADGGKTWTVADSSGG